MRIGRFSATPGLYRTDRRAADPRARGLGIGTRLVRECIAFAREAGYRTISLWTNDMLVGARRIYAAEGFRVVATEVHDSFGLPLTAETWELEL